ncbi:MAG: glycoside hydrolase family 18 protein [Pseudomonadota bacterium]
MNKTTLPFVCVLALIAACGTTKSGSGTPTPTPGPTGTPLPGGTTGARWVMPYINLIADNVTPANVNYASLSHLALSFLIPNSDGTVGNSLSQASSFAQHAHAAGKKFILSVGGAFDSDGFPGAVSSANRSKFVTNLITIVNSTGADGIDIDWEQPPSSEPDRSNMISLVNDLKAAKSGLIVTSALGYHNINGGAFSGATATFYSQLGAVLDQMNLMTYDMMGPWGGWVTWHNSPLQGEESDHPTSAMSTVAAYVAAGVPAGKLGIGIPFYGDCVGSPVTGPPQDWGGASILGYDLAMSYDMIMKSYYNAANYVYDTIAEVPYLSFSSPTGSRGCTYITYEDRRSIAAKGAYAQSSGIGGVIIWQLTEDYTPAGETDSLLQTVWKSFNP